MLLFLVIIKCVYMAQFQYKKEVLWGTLLACLVLVIFPFVSMGGDREKLYVDEDASGSQDGSENHPYETIWQALEDADGKADIYVAKGEYKENITLGKNVRLFGAGKNKTVIKADDDDEAVVTMKHKSEIYNVEVRSGKVGIVVKKKSYAVIDGVNVKKNDEEGILLLKADTRNDQKVSIVNSTIEKNGKTGIYSKEKKVILTDSTIQDNGGDGMIFEDGVEAWIEKNHIKNNGKSGIVVTVDESDIDIRNNSIKDNGREGIEVNAYGAYGRIDINKSTFYENERYAIARVVRGGTPTSIFDNVVVRGETKYAENGFGNVSRIIRVK